MASRKPPVSIVVPVYNAEGTIADCVGALLGLDYPRRLVQTIVVDNNSTDNTPDILQQFNSIDYVFEPKKGAYQARNTGAKFAQHDIIAFTDADCIPKPDWLSRLVDGLVHPQPPAANRQRSTVNRQPPTNGFAIVGGKVEAYPPSNLVERYIDYRKILDQEKMAERSEFSLPFFVTANCLVRRDVFEQLGGFDTYFEIAGDADFCWRAQQAGFGLRYSPEAVIVHKHRSDLLGLYSQSFQYGFGRASLFAKHGASFRRRFRFDWKEHVFLVESILKSIIAPVARRPKSEALLPVFDTIAYSALTLGKIYGSFKRGTLVL
ncbi:MAG TPA: glycosyltransferase [bacterium]|nr:glycosyltransferase [bacterium]